MSNSVWRKLSYLIIIVLWSSDTECDWTFIWFDSWFMPCQLTFGENTHPCSDCGPSETGSRTCRFQPASNTRPSLCHEWSQYKEQRKVRCILSRCQVISTTVFLSFNSIPRWERTNERYHPSYCVRSKRIRRCSENQLTNEKNNTWGDSHANSFIMLLQVEIPTRYSSGSWLIVSRSCL